MKRIGFGQVEPNHLSAQRTGQIYAQRPVEGISLLENGMFVKYTVNAGGNEVVSLTGDGEWMLVLNEVKLYDDAWRESYKDFAMMPDNRGEMHPRLFKTNVGDIFTTNCLEKANTGGKAEVEMTDVSVGATLAPNASGYLAAASEGDMLWKVVKVYTMPDGQPGVKIQRIK